MTVTVEGADRLARTLHAAAAELGDLTDTNRTVANLIAARARPPRLTGRLAASIAGAGDRTEGVAGSSVVYAAVHEYGWPRRNIRARRYLSAAFDASITEAIAAYRDATARAVAGVKGA